MSEIYNLVEETDTFLWYVSSYGYVFRINKKTNDKMIIAPYIHNDNLCVKIKGKCFLMKRLVAKYFYRNFDDNMCVVLKDGNQSNCKISNIKIVKKNYNCKEYSWRARSIPIVYEENGEKKVFKNITRLAKYLYVDPTTIKNYVYGKVNREKSILAGKKIYLK